MDRLDEGADFLTIRRCDCGFREEARGVRPFCDWPDGVSEDGKPFYFDPTVCPSCRLRSLCPVCGSEVIHAPGDGRPDPGLQPAPLAPQVAPWAHAYGDCAFHRSGAHYHSACAPPHVLEWMARLWEDMTDKGEPLAMTDDVA